MLRTVKGIDCVGRSSVHIFRFPTGLHFRFNNNIKALDEIAVILLHHIYMAQLVVDTQ